MATNTYFNTRNPTNEQDLIKDLFAEAIQMYGIDVYYIPRTIVKEDFIFHEDTMSKFESASLIEMYVESFERFDGQDDFVTQLGLQIDDTLRLSVSRHRFKTETTLDEPREGDLIFYPTTQQAFEIQFVEDEQQYYPLGKTHSFKLKCTIFRYDHEDFNTGVAEIDNIEDLRDSSDTGGDSFSSNADIQAESDEILDFTETNPFGNW